MFTFTPVNGDVVTCEMLSSITSCIAANPVTSNAITITVKPLLPVSISITASSNPFCQGNPVSFTATGINGGSTPYYQWKINANNVNNANNAVFTYVPVDGDVVNCVFTSSEVCTLGNPANSIDVTMTVITTLPAGITITASTNPFCEGNAVSFMAMPVNGGTAPGYQWVVNGVAYGHLNSVGYGDTGGFNGGLTFTYIPQAADSVWCVMTSNLSCVTMSPATSNKIFMIAAIKPTVGFVVCNDVITTVNAQPFKLKGGTPLGGIYSGPGVNSITGIFNPSVAGTGIKTIKYSYTNVATCSDEKSITITIQPAPSFTCGNVVTDVRDGKKYKTFMLANGRCWMSSNLEYGMTIDEFTPQTDNCLAERYIRSSSLVLRNSGYQWDKLMQYQSNPGIQGLCPPGWHIPSPTEWDDLLAFFNGPGLAGGPLNDTLLANGFHSIQQGFLFQNNIWAYTSGLQAGSMYWSSSASGADRAIARGLNDYNPSVSRYSSLRSNGLSARCLKD